MLPILLLAGSAAFVQSAVIERASSPIVDLGYELHQGFQYVAAGTQNTYYNFSNIRYAAPPDRFQAPKPPAVNRSKVQTGQQEFICPQGIEAWLNVASEIVADPPRNLTYTSVPPYGPANYTTPDSRQTEDCLFLDVLVPTKVYQKKASGRGAPVLLILHTSANTQGWKTFYGDGGGLVDRSIQAGSDGIVYVSFNYRVGMLGFLAGEAAKKYGEPNAALLDQRFAMLWVQKYIHLFGGNPNDITVLGKSSTGGDITAHLTAYGGGKQAPFRKAIAQSAFLEYIPPSLAEQVYQDALNLSGARSFAELQKLDTATIQKVNNILIGRAAPYGTFVFGPTVDGRFLTDDPQKLLTQGKYDHSVKMLTGLSSDEGLLFTSPFVKTERQFEDFLKQLFPATSSSVRSYILKTLYPADYSGTQGYTTPIRRLDLLMGDYSTVCPTYYLQKAFPAQSTYLYEFTNAPGVHAQDLGYTFYYENAPENAGSPTNPPVNATLARIHQRYLTRFVETGNPSVPDLPTFSPVGVSAAPGTGQNENNTFVGPVQNVYVNTTRCDWWQKFLYI